MVVSQYIEYKIPSSSVRYAIHRFCELYEYTDDAIRKDSLETCTPKRDKCRDPKVVVSDQDSRIDGTYTRVPANNCFII